MTLEEKNWNSSYIVLKAQLNDWGAMGRRYTIK